MWEGLTESLGFRVPKQVSRGLLRYVSGTRGVYQEGEQHRVEGKKDLGLNFPHGTPKARC